MHTSNRKSGFVESSFWHWLLPSWPAWGGSPHCNMARGQSAHNPVEEHRNFVLWVQVLKSIFGIPKKSKAPFLSSLDCNWKRWVHSATLLSCVAVTTNKKRKWNTNLSFWFWNWLSSVQCQINWIDLLGGIVRQHVLSLPFQLFVFCIFCRSFVFCIFAWKRKRRRQSVRHRVLSGSIPFPLWGATSQRDPRQW